MSTVNSEQLSFAALMGCNDQKCFVSSATSLDAVVDKPWRQSSWSSTAEPEQDSVDTQEVW